MTYRVEGKGNLLNLDSNVMIGAGISNTFPQVLNKFKFGIYECKPVTHEISSRDYTVQSWLPVQNFPVTNVYFRHE